MKAATAAGMASKQDWGVGLGMASKQDWGVGLGFKVRGLKSGLGLLRFIGTGMVFKGSSQTSEHPVYTLF